VAPRRRLHPVDLLALILAIGLAFLAYATLFRRTPVSRPVDPLLGATVELEFAVDRPWKRTFPDPHRIVRLEDYLEAEVLGADDAGGVRTLRLRILDRDRQRPDALTLFRTGIRLGTRIRLVTPEAEVEAEVLRVVLAEGGP
jgi:hypothetical protein